MSMAFSKHITIVNFCKPDKKCFFLIDLELLYIYITLKKVKNSIDILVAVKKNRGTLKIIIIISL